MLLPVTTLSFAENERRMLPFCQNASNYALGLGFRTNPSPLKQATSNGEKEHSKPPVSGAEKGQAEMVAHQRYEDALCPTARAHCRNACLITVELVPFDSDRKYGSCHSVPGFFFA